MTLQPATPHQMIFAHPIDEPPYNLLRYVRTNNALVHLYSVHDLSGVEMKDQAGAFEALAIAQAISPTGCWYCNPVKMPADHHRDHVIARANGGVNELHNLVIACPDHNCSKSDRSICEFDPAAGRRYMEALHAHVARIARANRI